jgi:hypothetical protein
MIFAVFVATPASAQLLHQEPYRPSHDGRPIVQEPYRPDGQKLFQEPYRIPEVQPRQEYAPAPERRGQTNTVPQPKAAPRPQLAPQPANREASATRTPAKGPLDPEHPETLLYIFLVGLGTLAALYAIGGERMRGAIRMLFRGASSASATMDKPIDWHKAFTGKPDPRPISEKNIYTAFARHVAAPAAVIIMVGMMVWMIYTEVADWLARMVHEWTFWAVIAAVCLLYFLIFILPRMRRHQAIPNEGAMIINITEDLTPTLRFACSLIIDVQIPHNDWHVLENAGLLNKIIFSYYSGRGDPGEKENWRDFTIGDLEMPRTIGFADTEQMLAAKAKLVEIVHIIKQHSEYLREAPRQDTIEV